MKTQTITSTGSPPIEITVPELGDPCSKCHAKPSTREVLIMVERPGGVAYYCDDCADPPIAPAPKWTTESPTARVGSMREQIDALTSAMLDRTDERDTARKELAAARADLDRVWGSLRGQEGTTVLEATHEANDLARALIASLREARDQGDVLAKYGDERLQEIDRLKSDLAVVRGELEETHEDREKLRDENINWIIHNDKLKELLEEEKENTERWRSNAKAAAAGFERQKVEIERLIAIFGSLRGAWLETWKERGPRGTEEIPNSPGFVEFLDKVDLAIKTAILHPGTPVCTSEKEPR